MSRDKGALALPCRARVAFSSCLLFSLFSQDADGDDFVLTNPMEGGTMDSAVTVLTPGSEREILRKVLPIWVEEINTQFDSRPSTRWHTALHFVLFDDEPEN